jgi:hypothetical protein
VDLGRVSGAGILLSKFQLNRLAFDSQTFLEPRPVGVRAGTRYLGVGLAHRVRPEWTTWQDPVCAASLFVQLQDVELVTRKLQTISNAAVGRASLSSTRFPFYS